MGRLALSHIELKYSTYTQTERIPRCQCEDGPSHWVEGGVDPSSPLFHLEYHVSLGSW